MARAAKDLGHADQDEVLHQCAVYCTDRQILKWVMTTPKKEEPQTAKKLATVTLSPVPVPAANSEPVIMQKDAVLPIQKPLKKPEPTIAALQIDNPLSGDALRDDLYLELEKLQKLKHEFEISFDEFQSAHHDGLDGQSQNSQVENEPPAEPLIEEIKASRIKIKTDNPKQKEQNEIIDQFIKTKPAIPKPKPQIAAEDLSEDSGMFSDNVVSETLVDILLKQGKKDKAVEVLKKLIWKFPQKKAYFAAQIDKLKS
jgi:hypothetical protein